MKGLVTLVILGMAFYNGSENKIINDFKFAVDENKAIKELEFEVDKDNYFIEDYVPDEIIENEINNEIERLELVGEVKYTYKDSTSPKYKQVFDVFEGEHYAILTDEKENVQFRYGVSTLRLKNDTSSEINSTFDNIDENIPYKYRFGGYTNKEIFEEVFDVEYGNYTPVKHAFAMYNIIDVGEMKVYTQGTKYEYEIYKYNRVGEYAYIGDITYFEPESLVMYEYRSEK